MKRIIKYIPLVGLVFILSSCLSEEKNLFPESAALRSNHAIENTKQILISPSNNNGWVMEYFPNNATEGYTFLMNFNSNTFATIAAKNKYTPNYTTDESAFNVIGDNGPVLTFNTYNRVFHIFSDPKDPQGGSGLDGIGLLGDYEFIVMNITNDLLTLKGKKRATEIIMYPLAKGQNWKTYFDILDKMDASLFNPKLPVMLTMKANTGDSIYYLTNGSNHIFTARTQREIDTEDAGRNIPFIITDYGLRFAQPFIMGEDTVQTFRLSDDKNKLVCIDKGKNATISALNPVDFFLYFHNNNRATAFINSDSDMSASVKSAYSAIENGVIARSRVLDYIQFVKDRTWSTSLAIRTSRTGGTLIEGFLSFTITKKNNSEIDFVFNGFTGNYNSNGKTYYDIYEGISDFVAFMEGSYKVEIQGIALSTGIIRLTSTTDSEKWFNLEAK